MDKKGQLSVGVILVAFVGIIVALALYQGIFGFIGQTTSSEVYNTTAGSAALVVPADGATTDLTGQELLDTPLVINATGGETVPSTNYTIAETISATDGLKRISYTAVGGLYEGASVNVSYTYGAEGYVDSGAGRSIVLLIPILAALAIGLIALGPTIKSGIEKIMN